MAQLRSEEFRKSAVQKFHNRGSRPVEEVTRGLGVSPWSLDQWAKRYAISPEMKYKLERRPQDWSAAEKLQAVIEFEGMVVDKRGEFLRREGLHSDHIEAWKKSMQMGLEPAVKLTKEERMERADDRRKIQALEGDLRRKDKALAEVTALLVLKKKADLIWGTGESE